MSARDLELDVRRLEKRGRDHEDSIATLEAAAVRAGLAYDAPLKANPAIDAAMQSLEVAESGPSDPVAQRDAAGATREP